MCSHNRIKNRDRLFSGAAMFNSCTAVASAFTIRRALLFWPALNLKGYLKNSSNFIDSMFMPLIFINLKDYMQNVNSQRKIAATI
jgi:hypothetical protein